MELKPKIENGRTAAKHNVQHSVLAREVVFIFEWKGLKILTARGANCLIFGVFFICKTICILQVVFFFVAIFIFGIVFIFKVFSVFWVIFIFEVMFVFKVVFIFEVIFIFVAIFILEVDYPQLNMEEYSDPFNKIRIWLSIILLPQKRIVKIPLQQNFDRNIFKIKLWL